MRLFQRRKAHATRAASPARLTESIPARARGQIAHALSDYTLPIETHRYIVNVTPWMVFNIALTWVLTRAWGIARLSNDDVRNVLAKATDEEVLDVIEAWYPAAQRVVADQEASSGEYYPGGSPLKRSAAHIGDQFRERINDVFDEHNVAWQLIGEQIVPRSSEAMHATVVEPVFALTRGNPKFTAVERSYQKALLELKPRGDPSDAITDAARALQEMLEAVGARGNALGPLLGDARKRELLAPHDSKLADAISNLGDWVSADRSQRGDAHHERNASRDDAGLAVHVAGALILRLAAERKR